MRSKKFVLSTMALLAVAAVWASFLPYMAADEPYDPGKEITENPHGPNPHGPNPNGPDPHDERHDGHMPKLDDYLHGDR
jgi:hypothetical protein